MNNIQLLRELKDINQKKLAKELNISQSAISEWEKGIRLPKTEHLIKMSKIFNESIDYILGKENDYGIIQTNANLSTKEDELIGYFRKIKPFEQGQILGIARTLAQGV